jgi:hypothetical protein
VVEYQEHTATNASMGLLHSTNLWDIKGAALG